MTVRFFFNDSATAEIYPLSLHDALPIFRRGRAGGGHASASASPGGSGKAPLRGGHARPLGVVGGTVVSRADALRRSEEHTSELSHANISYAVFCLKKKNHYHHSHRSMFA